MNNYDLKNILDENLKKDYERLVEEDSILPIKISDFYLKKVIDEVKHIGINGPLYRSVIPTREKIELKTSIETRDYVEEEKHMPVDGADYIIQKYKNRVLVIITDVCFTHCQYCFRTYNLSQFQKSNMKKTIELKVKALKEYLSKHNEIEEVILSGGDLLSIGYDNLKFVLKELKDYQIRIHTRAIVYQPDMITADIISLFKKYDVRLVFHINHPYEIDDVVEEKINEIRKSLVRMYAQFPLLRGINDNSKVIIKLLEKFDSLNIRTLSIFIPDPISYGASFRVSAERIEKIMDEVNWSTSSWVNSTRFTMDTTLGKVRRENIIKKEGKCITFSREGNEVKYYDLDDGIDVPSKIEKLLWRDYER